MKWSSKDPIDNMRCTRVREKSDPDKWHDNYLCVPPSSKLSFDWSSDGPIDGRECIQWDEPDDNVDHKWHDNFLCDATTSTQTCATVGNNKKSIKKFCKKAKRMETDSTFPKFWEFDKKLSEEQLLKQECKSGNCTPSDCCKEGRGRKCTNTDHRGKKKAFKESQCEDGSVLYSEKDLKKKKCTGSNGRICESKDCCENMV